MVVWWSRGGRVVVAWWSWSWSCRGRVVVVWWSCGGRVVVVWWSCGGRVVVVWWSCGGRVVVVWWSCGGRVVVVLCCVVLCCVVLCCVVLCCVVLCCVVLCCVVLCCVVLSVAHCVLCVLCTFGFMGHTTRIPKRGLISEDGGVHDDGDVVDVSMPIDYVTLDNCPGKVCSVLHGRGYDFKTVAVVHTEQVLYELVKNRVVAFR